VPTGGGTARVDFTDAAMKRIIRVLVGTIVLAAAASGAWRWWRTANIGPVERGRRVAEAHGCFGCHGPGGTHGIPNPGSPIKAVPAWDGGNVMMFAANEQELREWILDGMTASRSKDADYLKQRNAMQVRMPAFRGWLPPAELNDLVAYVKAVSWLDAPKDALPLKGRDLAGDKGCFSCHGPEGRGCMPNAGSFKGYIPAWDGPDFPDVAADDNEIREWILDGVCQRIARHPLGGFFVKRQRVQMPAFRGQVTDEELRALVAYIRWLRPGSTGS
jgi:mono/diheme cytochrome c family protein